MSATFNPVVNNALIRIDQLNHARGEARRMMESQVLSADEYSFVHRSIHAEIEWHKETVKQTIDFTTKMTQSPDKIIPERLIKK
jgi:hypothetical protein